MSHPVISLLMLITQIFVMM